MLGYIMSEQRSFLVGSEWAMKAHIRSQTQVTVHMTLYGVFVRTREVTARKFTLPFSINSLHVIRNKRLIRSQLHAINFTVIHLHGFLNN